MTRIAACESDEGILSALDRKHQERLAGRHVSSAAVVCRDDRGSRGKSFGKLTGQVLGKEATVGDARGPDPLGIHVEVGNHVVDEIGLEAHLLPRTAMRRSYRDHRPSYSPRRLDRRQWSICIRVLVKAEGALGHRSVPPPPWKTRAVVEVRPS